MKNPAHLSACFRALLLTGLLGCDTDGLSVGGPQPPIVFEDSAGLFVVDPESAQVTRLAEPVPPAKWFSTVILSPSGRRLVRAVNAETIEVFEVNGPRVASFSSNGWLVGWLDDSTLLRSRLPGQTSTSFVRIDVTGAERGTFPLPAEVSTWDQASAELSPDGSQLALTRFFNPTTPQGDTVILLVSTKDSRVLDRISFPPTDPASPLGWLRTGELVLVLQSAFAKAGSPAVRHPLERSLCPAQAWTNGRLLARSVETAGTTDLGSLFCGTLWELDVDRGALSRHWTNDLAGNGGVHISRDGEAATFEREGALWVASPDGSQPRRLVALSEKLTGLAW